MRKTRTRKEAETMKMKEAENEREWTAEAVPKQAREERWEEWKLFHASPEVWTARMLAGLHKEIKGNKWYSLADKAWREATLQAGFAKVKKNKGSAGSDGQSIAAFEANLKANCAKLSQELQSGRYQRRPVKRIMIPKAGGGEGSRSGNCDKNGDRTDLRRGFQSQQSRVSARKRLSKRVESRSPRTRLRKTMGGGC